MDFFMQDETQTQQISQIENFKKQMDNLSYSEEKVQFILEKMNLALSSKEKPDFRLFWDLKSMCLNLFKDHLNPTSRVEFWKKYLEISKEARKLKDLIDEQTSFEVEQIEITITSLEKDQINFEEICKNVDEIIISDNLLDIISSKQILIDYQKELCVLNAFSARVNSLRKEIINTLMKLSVKNKLLKRLS